jgi:hypothetical protein
MAILRDNWIVIAIVVASIMLRMRKNSRSYWQHVPFA